jgi:hypothetical protein
MITISCVGMWEKDGSKKEEVGLFTFEGYQEKQQV